MRLASIVREAWRDLATGTARALTFVVVTLIAIAGPILLDLQSTVTLSLEAQHFRQSLAHVQVLRIPDHIDPAACLALEELPQIEAAAAVRGVDSIAVGALPHSPLVGFEATTSIGTILNAGTLTDSTIGGVYIPENVAETLGVSPGSTTHLAGRQTPIAGVFPWDENDGRRVGYAYSAFVPVPPIGVFDECWVSAWPLDDAVTQLLYISQIPSGDADTRAEFFAVNQSLGRQFDGYQKFITRPTAGMVGAIALIALGIGFMSSYIRRTEFSADLHAGVHKVDLLVKILTECSVWALIAGAWATISIAVVLYQAPLSDRMALLCGAATQLAVGLLGLILGASCGVLLVRERHLLRHFQRR